MGFADLSIAEIAADYSIPVDKRFSLFRHLLIADKHQKTRLALEAAKAIISQILSETHPQGTSSLMVDTEATETVIWLKLWLMTKNKLGTWRLSNAN